MKLINRLEKRLGKFAIPNLTVYIIITYIIGYFLEAMQRIYQVNLLGYLALNPYAILHGQVWRLFTWVIAPPNAFSIWTVIMLLFYYQLGTALERIWGKFLYNIYIFFGLFMTVIGAFILYAILGADVFRWLYLQGATIFSTYYVSLSIFLGFAMTFPEEKILFMLFLPIRIKYLAIAEVAICIYDIWQTGFNPVTIVLVVSALASVIVFFFATRDYSGFGKAARDQKRRRKEFEAAMSGRFKENQERYRKIRPEGDDTTKSSSSAGRGPARHKCTICGRTELDAPELEFRFCTKCAGNHEYCQEHLFTHQHIQ